HHLLLTHGKFHPVWQYLPHCRQKQLVFYSIVKPLLQDLVMLRWKDKRHRRHLFSALFQRKLTH
ncbi:BgTH12-05166, partial [Blumeria graminis f. sp. triticale]